MQTKSNPAVAQEIPHNLNVSHTILPGSWLGVLGGGQLGRMFAQAAQRLGYRVAIFEAEADSPAAQVADIAFCPWEESNPNSELQIRADSQSPELLVARMAKLCDVVTLEFENIPADLVRLAGEFTQTSPCVRFLEVCQDRKLEKQSVADLGCPTTPFVPVTSESQAVQAAEQLGFPLVLKTARSGYDGKGQCVVHQPTDLHAAWQSLGSEHVVAEKWIDFVAEVSMITARNLRGQVVHYPLFENEHANHILDITRCPVRPDLLGLQGKAEEICCKVAEAFSVVGLFCIEFFVTADGNLLVNEIAPRPHNSGHLTIEAFDISQFEMQVRAICNLPLRKPIQISPAAMVNLLGDIWSGSEPTWAAILQRPRTFLHLYGKSAARPGRKMGHITVLDSENACRLVRDARQSLLVSN